jgi:hypothetical protein
MSQPLGSTLQMALIFSKDFIITSDKYNGQQHETSLGQSKVPYFKGKH